MCTEHLPPGKRCRGGANLSGLILPQGEEIENGIDYEALLTEVGRHLITESLRIAGGNKAKAARLLSMDRGTLRYNIKRMGIEP